MNPDRLSRTTLVVEAVEGLHSEDELLCSSTKLTANGLALNSHLKKLRWQCRRGTKELDYLLLQYLDEGYLQADEQEQAQFAALLDKEDDWLLGVLLAEMDPGLMKGLVGKIKRRPE